MSRDSIQTFTGKTFVFGQPSEESICIEDIAHALALVNRFGGHTREPYSVAQHSVLVSYLLVGRFKLQGLLHDAHEAYVGDNTRAFKELIPGIKGVERQIDEVIFGKFGVRRSYQSDAAVKVVDNLMLSTEASKLLAHRCEWIDEWDLPKPIDMEIEVLGWRDAEALFLETFNTLTGA